MQADYCHCFLTSLLAMHLPQVHGLSAASHRVLTVRMISEPGKEYGSGSSRDWAAKGVALLGVKAVLAESYERIHRSNLVGMGVLPLQFLDGETADSLGLTGNLMRHAATESDA